jgi:hypothetical protein
VGDSRGRGRERGREALTREGGGANRATAERGSWSQPSLEIRKLGWDGEMGHISTEERTAGVHKTHTSTCMYSHAHPHVCACQVCPQLGIR